MAFDPNDTETKEAIAKIVEEAKAGIETKNRELLAELKEARKGRQIDPAELEKLEAKLDDVQAKLTAAEKQAKDATKAAETAQKALETESSFTQKLLVQDGLKSALIAAGVKDDDFLDALTTKFAPTASIVAEGSERKVMIGDKPLADAIKAWAGSDSGKKFVAAPLNGGGGAPGGKGGEGGATITRAQYDADPVAGIKAVRDGAKVVDQAA
jgi:hypothetical protein